ncbi:oxygen-dependent coproporphyrinogen oxidase [Sphingomonas sp. SUN039]|uniref:oxygen-dependent coproporphyrinogen oxidase n=1 Tax=Sphingomonas sp. SUN039 TaxID=2937787 RepID=UPI0021644CDE|nr:oxygen-dependent coproporphyrinogen oxidase [Sphingomonas sp. SUN039]UVO53982.1 oxygen-dependent coproporphyrinogen oxidase [Sphingomonas sp. SUN039]
MIELDAEQQQARDWFERLRDRICASFESIEREAASEAKFDYLEWFRDDDASGNSGGGVRGVMKGKVFEKVGVNVSTVGGAFAPEFAPSIHGAGENPNFFATGISLVAHMSNPHVPAVHMNCRFLVTTKRWFGGGADLNPALPKNEDTADFHAAMERACAASPTGDYPRFKQWAEDYFWLPHRKVHRGVGGIFYDHMEGDFDANFALTRALGEAFLDSYPMIVRRRMATPFTEAEEQALLEWRGRYAEFNLVYDRGTSFGLKTGGNIDAILMSLPPRATWS